jgi:hypothetical protein
VTDTNAAISEYFCCSASRVNLLAPPCNVGRPSVHASRPHGCQQRLDADDVQHTRKIVAEYVQRHFGRYIGQSLHQKVRRTHPHLQCGERMLDGFTALNLLPSMATLAFASRPILRHNSTNRAQTFLISGPLSLRKSAMVL